MKKWLFIAILFPTCLFGQYQIKGKVFDSQSKEALAFVNIIANQQRMGTTTGIDGTFTLNSKEPITQLQLSYVGYQQQSIDVTSKKYIDVAMVKTSYELMEFNVLPGENPAHRIVQKLVDNRKLHNPEKSLNFQYESYSKMYFTGQIDSAILNNPDTIPTLDTSDQKAIDWLDKHHIFMMESVTERKYKLPDKSYEKVIASRVSGLKNPSFALLASQYQSFSFYNPTLNVMGQAYLNPVTPNSINKYLFLIEDTTFNGTDTVFIISYRPRKGKNFAALKGLLYINTDGYALQNVIAEPVENEEVSIKIQQQYQKIEGAWFPVQLNTNVIFNNLAINTFKVVGIGKTYLKKIQINPELANKEFSYVEQEIDRDANKKDEAFWEQYREDTLSVKEQNTYHFIDSLGKAENLDRKMKFFEALATGQVKMGYVSLDVNRLIRYNDYEGFRLGGGLHTNTNVARWVSVGGYGAYGFDDKEFKYGGDVDFKINKRNDVSLNFSAIKDVEEPGVQSFYDYKQLLLSSAGTRVLYLSRMNNIDKLEARLKFRTLRYLKVYLFANQENVEVTNDYYFKKVVDANTILHDQYYTFNEVGAEFRYAFKEKVIESFNMLIPQPSNYPILYAKVAQGLNVLNGEYQYTRYALRAEKRFFIRNLGWPLIHVEAGLTDGKVPQHKLNSSLGTNKLSDWLLISTENAFETMLPYEFFSSEYVHVHFRHNFGSFLFKAGKFEPELAITSSVGFGALSYQGLHEGVSYSTMEKGFFESGLLINRLLKMNFTTFGVGAFYRYGPYKLPKSSDNFVVKMSLGFSF
ncbi:MAG: carboxypeptidase-like regulatory domain-containing protein [Flavobacteriales bacterium]|nr:carboxypeptidase-like regulatory domain-containing protein [Flavobacteriales bacterium]